MSEPQQTLTLQQALDLAIRHHSAGRLPEAKSIYEQIIKADGNQHSAWHLLGVTAYQVGNHGQAVKMITKALNLKPDFPEAYSNLGLALQGLGKSDDAITSYRKALSLKPDYAEAHNNLGIALRSLGRLNESAASYREALRLQPNRPDAHNNLGVTLQELGRLEESIANYQKALEFQPEFAEAWSNLQSVTKVFQFTEVRKGRKGKSFLDGLSETTRQTMDFAMLEYFLAKFRPHESEEVTQSTLAAMPSKIEEEVPIDGKKPKSAAPPPLADKLIALLHFGRSGSGLLHSLLDSHPEVSTLPSIYLRGYFNAGVWKTLSADGWRKLPERFADEFAVLFDANSPKSTPGMTGEDSSLLGRKEGMSTVGENRNESLSLDRDQFCAEALRLMENYTTIDPASFLLIVHAAFEKTLGTKTHKHTVLYHVHNPSDFAKLNFLRYSPDARLIMTVREPVQSCESWIRVPFQDNDCGKVVNSIVTMLLSIDQIAFRLRDSIGVRLEDLKVRPEDTLRSLCTWLGIKETPSLYQMTAQGKKWWGDPTSPDYDENKAMDPFDQTSIQRPVGSIFSERDQFVLRTLFYPFSVRFGYREPDPTAFEKDLKEVRPLLDELLDFEKVMSERSNTDPDQFKNGGIALLLRATLVDRWNVLNEFKDYPHLLPPLKITAD